MIALPWSAAVELACGAARRSPCQKSKRGVVIYSTDRQDFQIEAVGFNGPPPGFSCNGKCFSRCRDYAVHAEQRALVDLIPNREIPSRAHLVHVKVVDGELVPSGGPSCPQCSKLIVEAEIEVVWLYHADGWRSYSAQEFHELTLTACEIGGSHA